MKKFLFLTTILLLGIASCGDKEDNHALIGKWYLYSVNTEEGTMIVPHSDCGKMHIEFRTDNYVDIVNYTEDCTMAIIRTAYSESDNKITTTFEGQSIEAEYEIKRDELIVQVTTHDEGEVINAKLVLKRM